MAQHSGSHSAGGTFQLNQRYGQANRRFKDDYDMKEELGKGGFGTVRRCICRQNRREYAAKINNTPDRKSAMEGEFEICKKFADGGGHPNIVNLFDSITEGDIVYNIYELAIGGDLMEYIVKKEFLSQTEAANAINQILKGVHFIHTRNVIHRDLKPHNILVQKKSNKEKVYKVTDFGLSHWKGGGPVGGKAGTAMYYSPEVAQDQPYDIEYDVWSCGVILYYMIAGYHPFWDDTQQGIQTKIQSVTFDYPNPEWLGLNKAQAMINRMLCLAATRAPIVDTPGQDPAGNPITIQGLLTDPFIVDNVTPPGQQPPQPEPVDPVTTYEARRNMKLQILQNFWAANQNVGAGAEGGPPQEEIPEIGSPEEEIPELGSPYGGSSGAGPPGPDPSGGGTWI